MDEGGVTKMPAGTWGSPRIPMPLGGPKGAQDGLGGAGEGKGSKRRCPWGGGAMGTPPQNERLVPRWCRREADERRRETLEQRGETRVLEQRSPWGVLRFGVLGQPLTQHLLPYARTLPLPLFAPPDLRGAKAGVPRTLSRSLSHEAQRG